MSHPRDFYSGVMDTDYAVPQMPPSYYAKRDVEDYGETAPEYTGASATGQAAASTNVSIAVSTSAAAQGAPVGTAAKPGEGAVTHAYMIMPMGTAGHSGAHVRVVSRSLTGQGVHPCTGADIVTRAIGADERDSGTCNYGFANVGHRRWRVARNVECSFTLEDIEQKLRGLYGASAANYAHCVPIYSKKMGPMLAEILDLAPHDVQALHTYGHFKQMTGGQHHFIVSKSDAGTISRSGLYEKLCGMGETSVGVSNIALLGCTIENVQTDFPISLGVRVSGTKNDILCDSGWVSAVVGRTGCRVPLPINLTALGPECTQQEFGTFATVDADEERAALMAKKDTRMADQYLFTPHAESLATMLAEGGKDLASQGITLGEDACLTSAGIEYLVSQMKDMQGRMRLIPAKEMQVCLIPTCEGGWVTACQAIRERCANSGFDPREYQYTFNCMLTLDMTYPSLAYGVRNVLADPMRLAMKNTQADAAPAAPMSTGAKVSAQGAPPSTKR